MAERVPSEPSAFTHLLHKINGEELVVRMILEEKLGF